ncbi:hypothetical protein GQ44DRAFT_415344 [Phaeosphaeriaceae sp. PMI808]|nr:hypothetical protein GQ44DRAFT_415344 [Phaeosphaeriaceae sp. PMI808]
MDETLNDCFQMEQVSNLSPSLLILFFERLPQELRDRIYGFVVSYPRDIFILQPPTLIFRYETLHPVAPFKFLPKIPLHSLPTNIVFYVDDLFHGLVARFFATNRFYTRYRYTSDLYALLTNPFLPSSCIPAQHFRRLTIGVAPPESAEDDMGGEGLLDEEADVEWHGLFPSPRTSRGRMWRETLEADFALLGDTFVRSGRDAVESARANRHWEVGVFLEHQGWTDSVPIRNWMEVWMNDVRNQGGHIRITNRA